MRIQFYPSISLQTSLTADANEKQISLSALVVSILEEYYKISPQLPPFTQLITQICDEVENYLPSIESPEQEFPLSAASATYRSIPMTANGKPNPLRMRIGKAFNKQTRSGRFAGIIEQVFLENNKPKRTTDGNRAAVYVMINLPKNGKE